MIKIGINLVPVTLSKLMDAARLAEELGFESGWIGEHIALPMEPRVPYPYGEASFRADTSFPEPFVALAQVAAATETFRLGTGICILPARNLLLAARAVATLDVLSNGRVDLGVGTGWSEDEFEILDQDFHTRGRRLDEYIDALDALWQQETPSFAGEFVKFDRIGFAPKPIQRPRVPVHVGGFADVALRRAAQRGDGWYGSAGSPDEARAGIEKIRRMLVENGRDPESFVQTIMLWTPPDKSTVEAYAQAGAHRIVVTPFNYPQFEPDPLGKIKAFARYCGLTR